MNAEEHIKEAIEQHCEAAAYKARESLANSVVIGPYDAESSDDFAIYIGQTAMQKGWRIGHWKTRAEACDEASKLVAAIRQHGVRK